MQDTQTTFEQECDALLTILREGNHTAALRTAQVLIGSATATGDGVVPAVGVLLADEDCRGVWLAKRKGADGYEGCLQSPGGEIGAGESTLAAGSREVEEETGLAIAPSKLLYLCSGEYVRPDGLRYSSVSYIARTPLAPKNTEPDKAEDWKFYTWDELLSTNEPLMPPVRDAIMRVGEFASRASGQPNLLP